MTYRRLRVPQKTPINFGEPLVLLDLRSAALAAQAGPFSFIEQTRDNVLAGAELGRNTTSHGAVSDVA